MNHELTIVYFAPLHCLLRFNGTCRNKVDPSRWIKDYDEKNRSNGLSEDAKCIVTGCERIREVLLAEKICFS